MAGGEFCGDYPTVHGSSWCEFKGLVMGEAVFGHNFASGINGGLGHQAKGGNHHTRELSNKMLWQW
jgi:hypothetical protein